MSCADTDTEKGDEGKKIMVDHFMNGSISVWKDAWFFRKCVKMSPLKFTFDLCLWRVFTVSRQLNLSNLSSEGPDDANIVTGHNHLRQRRWVSSVSLSNILSAQFFHLSRGTRPMLRVQWNDPSMHTYIRGVRLFSSTFLSSESSYWWEVQWMSGETVKSDLYLILVFQGHRCSSGVCLWFATRQAWEVLRWSSGGSER